MQKWLLIYCLFFSIGAIAQNLQTPYPLTDTTVPSWVTMMYAPNPNLSAVQVAFERYYQNHPFQKNSHTQYYKRWQRHFARYPHWGGMNPTEQRHYQQKQAEYYQKSLQLKQQRSPTSSWQCLGPFDFDKTAASTSYACGAAHVYTVEKSKSNSNVLYAGTATAGVWKSTDNGKNWSLTTPNLPVSSVRALEISFNDPQIVYFASDLNGKVYKTNNGGLSWSITGGTAFNSLQHACTDMVMHPTFSNVLLLASNQGLYRTNNSGATWTLIQAGNFQEIEFHPHLPHIVYAVKQVSNRTEFYKSIDNGLTFTQKPTGWPVPAVLGDQRRTEIAVSPNDSNKVYAVLTGQVGFASGLHSMLVSNDAGESWSSICCGAALLNFPSASNPNLMHWSDDGLGNGGQYYYDLALAAAPNDADSVLVGGVNLWFSSDGANTFSCPAQWDHSYKDNYVHADIHDIRIYGHEIWIACDGGIFYSDDNGAHFQRRMKGIEGTDFWGFGTGFQDGEVMLGGTYHNGTLLKDNHVYINDWLSTDGGDNYRGFVHPIHTRLTFSDYGKKSLSGNRLIPNTTTPMPHLPHAGITVGFSGSITTHPQIYNTIYSTEFYNLWKSENNGLTWEKIYDFGDGLITSFEISWSNPDIMYLNYHPSQPNADRLIYKSTDGGYSWTDITPPPSLIPNHRWVTYDLTISATDANTLWAARISKYEGTPILDGEQVYQTTDGGLTWQNKTTPDLDGVYSTNIEHQKGSQGGLYLGTRNAVYYKNDNLSNWVLFNNNLPLRTHSVQLVPYYKAGKLRNGTNRSVYEVDFYENTPPVAQISVHKKNSACHRDTFYFASHSTARSNASYTWQFENGQPSSSTTENPKVVFGNSGSYNVTLTVSDAWGSDTQVLTDFIHIASACEKDTIPGYALQLSTPNDYVQTEALQLTTNQMTLSAWIKADNIQNQYTGIIAHSNDSFPAGLLFGNNNELIFQWPGAQWTWNSGLFVPTNEWAHVALVISPDSARVYLNGVPSTYAANMGLLHWKGGITIGRYANWISRTFKGKIDEVCIWDIALSQDAIRASQHLTKYTVDQPNLIHYYQFNALAPLVQDRSGLLHGTFFGTASRVLSTAPVGGGRSEKIEVNNSGLFVSAATQLCFATPSSGIYSDGTLVLNRLNVSPDQIPANNLVTGGYWIINNYGHNTQFTALDSILFKTLTPIPFAPNDYTLYHRSARADGATWGVVLDTCDAIQQQEFSFSNHLALTTWGQLVITVDSATIVTAPRVEKEYLPNPVTVFPNPIGKEQLLHIQTQASATYEVSIYNLEGQKIATYSFEGNSTQVQLPALTQGIYAYRIASSEIIYNGLFRYQ